MPIMFKHAGHEIDIEDLPMEAWVAISDSAGTEWWRLLANPLVNAKAAVAIVNEACKYLEVEPPKPLTPKNVVQMFTVSTGDSLPVEFEDSIPKAEGERSTT